MNLKTVFEAMLVLVIGTVAAAETTTTPTSAAAPASASAPASAPASQPADQIILIRIGDREVITQADFDRVIHLDPATGYAYRNRILLTMTQDLMMWLYLQDHPDLVTAEQVHRKMNSDARLGGLDSIEAARQKLESEGYLWSDYKRFVAVNLAKAELVRKGLEMGKDENRLKEIFEARREEFDGTYVRARQITFNMPIYATSEERQAVREKLQQMRADILAGRRTWEQCVAQSDSAVRDGDMGTFNRHRMKHETLSAAAFALAPGEMSDVIETVHGYHLLQVTEKVTPDGIPWEHTQKEMRKWLELELLSKVLDEAKERYPVVGVRPPQPPKLPPATLASQPQSAPARTRPASRPASTRPESKTSSRVIKK